MCRDNKAGIIIYEKIEKLVYRCFYLIWGFIFFFGWDNVYVICSDFEVYNVKFLINFVYFGMRDKFFREFFERNVIINYYLFKARKGGVVKK